MTNINKIVNGYIDKRIEIKKVLLRGMMNISALARKIAKEKGLEKNIDAIISSLRRYSGDINKKTNIEKVYSLLKKAKISTKTKLRCLILHRNDVTENKFSTIYSQISVKRNTTLQSIEHTNEILILADIDLIKEIRKIFLDRDIIRTDKRLSQIIINFDENLSKIAGVFAAIFNELAINDVSVIYSWNSPSEVVLIIEEKNLEKAFSIILTLTG